MNNNFAIKKSFKENQGRRKVKKLGILPVKYMY